MTSYRLEDLFVRLVVNAVSQREVYSVVLALASPDVLQPMAHGIFHRITTCQLIIVQDLYEHNIEYFFSFHGWKSAF